MFNNLSGDMCISLFTHFRALHGNILINQAKLEKWTNTRHTQIRHSELVYIAHQIDILGTMVNDRF
jgi:hypothetical protein